MNFNRFIPIRTRSVFAVPVVCLACFMSTTMSMTAQADEHIRTDLSLMQDMVDQLFIMVERVEKRQSQLAPSVSYYFDTEQLKADLTLINQGVDDYLSPSRLPARYVEPINGDYVRRR